MNLLSREWNAKAGGVAAISYLVQRLDVSFSRFHQLPFLSALFYLLRDLAPSVSVVTIEDATSTLTTLIKVCGAPHLAEERAEATKALSAVVDLLVATLPSPNPRVRKMAQTALESLADITREDIPDLLKPFIDSKVRK